MEIRYKRQALATLGRMPVTQARLIQSKIELLVDNPKALANNVKALKGTPGYLRLRVGDWRVIYSIEGPTLTIQRIAPRGSAYDD